MNNVLEYLEKSAIKHPEKTAFADTDAAVSYQSLLAEARCIGTALSVLLPQNSPVAVFMDKSVASIEAFMGAVYAGCFYVQMDVRQPAERLLQILSTLNAQVVVTDAAHESALREMEIHAQILLVDELKKCAADEKALAAIRAKHIDTDPLYCMFTSGSTGVPKGVLVPHRSVIDFIDCFTVIFGITENDVIGNQAPFDFDVSVKDIYSTLKTGATMQIIPTKYFSIPVSLLDMLAERKVTTLIWAVSALCIISQLHGFDYRIPKDVNKVIFSGEVMPVKQLNIWREALPGAMYANVYGPTEITCNCTYYIVDRDFAPGDVLPMGKAFPNERVFLLDGEDSLVEEPHEEGEICVAGTALSLGYYNNPEATEKVFVQNPLNQNYKETIYRTGDLGYYNDRDELCFSTRKDFQIKHMGHRIELGEIEAALDRIPQIERACCLFIRNRIIAFYAGEIDKKEIAQELGKTLPAYMIPNGFEKRDTFPLSKNAKIDRKALQADYERGKKR